MWAIVPIKTFARAKQRLANVLNEDERRSLMLAMARDVLTCLSQSETLTGVLIVSRAREADVLAETFATERFAESPRLPNILFLTLPHKAYSSYQQMCQQLALMKSISWYVHTVKLPCCQIQKM